MSNITTNRQNFVILGESMKKYVKIVVLTLIVSIFGAIILFSSLFATINPYTMGSSTPDIASSLNEMLGGLIVFVVAIIGLGNRNFSILYNDYCQFGKGWRGHLEPLLK